MMRVVLVFLPFLASCIVGCILRAMLSRRNSAVTICLILIVGVVVYCGVVQYNMLVLSSSRKIAAFGCFLAYLTIANTRKTK